MHCMLEVSFSRHLDSVADHEWKTCKSNSTKGVGMAGHIKVMVLLVKAAGVWQQYPIVEYDQSVAAPMSSKFSTCAATRTEERAAV